MFNNSENQYKTIQSFINEFDADLKAHAPKFSGRLAGSIKTEAKEINTGFEIDTNAESYADFLNKGVNGASNDVGSPYTFKRYPPISAIQSYADAYGIPVFALQKSIYRDGIKGNHYADNAVNNNVDEFADDMNNALWEDYYKDDYNDNKNKYKK